VSDVWQGPGWWLASDDKWYPPELHPSSSAVPVGVSQEVAFEQAQGVGGADYMAAFHAAPPQAMPSPSLTTTATDFSSGVVAANVVSAGGRKRPSFLPALVVLSLLVCGGAGVYALTQDSSGNAIAGASANQAVALAMTAVREVGSVHVVTSIQIQGQTATYVNDTGSLSGKQVITAGGAQVTVIVVEGTAYVNANQLAMSEMFQSPTSVSQRFAGTWLSFPSDDQAFDQISPTLTLGSLLQRITPTGPLTKLPEATVSGRSVIGIRGELPGGGSGTLYLSATGLPLPVAEVSGPPGGQTTSIFGGWGEPVHPTAPSGAIPGSETGLF